MKIAHLSDLHFGAEIPDVVLGLHARLGEIAPDLVVISGDFTMAARPREFADARAFVESLPFPVVSTPGNHDIPVHNLAARFTLPLRRFRRAIGPVTGDRFESGGVALLSLNSARPWDLSFNWSHGRLSHRQIARADAFFSSHADAAFKALVVHHPFFVPEALPGFRTIGNGEEMLRVLARRRVDAVLSGHLHQQSRTTRRFEVESASHEIVLLQVATATSSRHRDQPNAFAVIETGDGDFKVSAEVWTGEAFEPGAID